MLSRIVDLELEIKEKEDTITSLCKEFEEKQLQYEEKIAGKLFVFGHAYTYPIHFGLLAVYITVTPIVGTQHILN